MNFIDANVIAYAFYENPHQEVCRNILREGGVTDTLVLVEAFNIIEVETKRDIAIRVIRGLLKTNIHIVDTNMTIIFEALKRTEKYRLKCIDLVHYTTALLHNCSAIMSYDKDFDGLELPREEA